MFIHCILLTVCSLQFQMAPEWDGEQREKSGSSLYGRLRRAKYPVSLWTGSSQVLSALGLETWVSVSTSLHLALATQQRGSLSKPCTTLIQGTLTVIYQPIEEAEPSLPKITPRLSSL